MRQAQPQCGGPSSVTLSALPAEVVGVMARRLKKMNELPSPSGWGSVSVTRTGEVAKLPESHLGPQLDTWCTPVAVASVAVQLSHANEST
jgi:hypothetical protein